MTWIEVAGYDNEDEVVALNEIAMNTAAIAGAKGVLSDLRVTPTGTVTVGIAAAQTLATVTTVTTVTTCSTLSTITNIPTIGSLSTNAAVKDWSNQTAVLSFTNNVTRP